MSAGHSAGAEARRQLALADEHDRAAAQAHQLQDMLAELRKIWLSDRTRASDVRVNQRQVTDLPG